MPVLPVRTEVFCLALAVCKDGCALVFRSVLPGCGAHILAGITPRNCAHSFRISVKTISEALADGRLEAILAPERERAKAARLRLMREKDWL